jgi:glycosyltransferase involved in cell wall biosynthesis
MLSAVWRLILHIRRNPVEIIYICGARGSLLLRLLRFFLPGTILVHGVRWNPDSNTCLDRFFRVMERFTHRFVDAWVTNSAIAKQTLVSRCGIPSERVFVIYNGLESFPTIIPSLVDRPMEVLTVANLNPRKGHREYLKVVREVLNTMPDAKFLFVGRDDMNGEVERTIKKSGLSGHVQYEGFHNDLSPWLRRARVMVLPSLWGEGCPTSILEGFAFGLPVVAYAIDGIPELIADGVDGVLVPPDKSNELASAILRMLENPTRAEDMGISGRDKVVSYFTLARCSEEHSQTFRKLISKSDPI